LLAPLGLLGFALGWRRRGWPRMLLLFTVVYSCTIIVFFVFSRFRMVVVPALFVFGAFGAVELFRRWRNAIRGEQRYGPALAATALFLGLAAFVNLPVRAMGHTWSYRIASAIGLPTRLETSSIGHFNLAVSYAKLAKGSTHADELLRLAEAQLREALRLNPPYAKTHVELGKVLARQKRTREAIEIYREAETIEPNDYKIHHALGLLHQSLEELDDSARAFRRALGLAPRHTPSATHLGRILLAQGRQAEAAEAFRHALRHSPGDREAREGLRRATRSGG
jgi:tetratricopeptide (TPR) repeat protein